MSGLDTRRQSPAAGSVPRLVLSPGRFFPNAAVAPVAADSPDTMECGWAITARSGVGVYVLALSPTGSYPKCVGLKVSLAKAVPDPAFTWCEIAHDATAGTVTFAVFSAGVAVDYAAAPATFLRVEVDFRNQGGAPL